MNRLGRIAGWIVLAVAAACVALTCAVDVAHADGIHSWREPSTLIVHAPVTDKETDALCAQFERLNDTAWRTETGAIVYGENIIEDSDDVVSVEMRVPPGDVTEALAFDLFWTLESSCHYEPDE